MKVGGSRQRNAPRGRRQKGWAVSPSTAIVHPTAVIENGAVVGQATKIWHHTQVRTGAVVGSGCVLGKNVYVDEQVSIGDRVKIQNNVSLYRGVELGDEVFVGPSAVFTNDLRPRAVDPEWQVLRTRVRQGASLGANATIVCGVEVGEAAMVGAGAVVTASVLPNQLVAGNPARHLGWVCPCGEVISRESERPANIRCSSCGEGEEAPPTPREQIRLAKVIVGKSEEDAVLSVLRSGHLAAGSWVASLESQFARAHGVPYAVAVSNGTAALVAALRAHEIGPGDEVITSPLTFVATLNSILEVGATARFADVAEDLTVSPSSVAALITPRTRAVLPVHLYGLPAAMDELAALARTHGLAIIEDAAQAHGARVGEKPVGSFGTGAFSLYATKNITCGEGGVITTDDEEIAGRLRLLRNHGMRARYDYAMPGHNLRLTDMQAAVAVRQLDRLPSVSAARSRNAGHLSNALKGLAGVVLPDAPAGRSHAWHQYTIQLTADASMARDLLRRRLESAGVESGVYYPRLVHDYSCYHNHPLVAHDLTPRAARAVREVLSLPVHPHLSAGDLDRIASEVRAALR